MSETGVPLADLPASIRPQRRTASGWRFQGVLPKLVLAPSVFGVGIAVYGFMIFTFYLSLTNSRMLPDLTFAGFSNYVNIWNLDTWNTSLINVAIFTALYLALCVAIGLGLAILLDQRIRGEAAFRTIYLYPMALSFIVTGVAWRWFLDPGIGLQNAVRNWGWESFTFNWIQDNDLAIYTIVIAAVWQSSGFAMAVFLAGMRSIDNEVIKAAQIDGATPFHLYRRIIVPHLRPAFLSVFIVLINLAIRVYDLVVAMTNGGPGRATFMPAMFMFSYTFDRQRMATGATSAIIMTVMVAAIVVPYVLFELKQDRQS
jgi:glucose/mannose transport system permease protein